MRPFEKEDKYLFFGRNEHSLIFRERIYKSHFVSVLGPSGSGKSSFVRAKIIPELEEEGKSPEDPDRKWTVVKMQPGKEPMENLASALTSRIPELFHWDENITTKNVPEELKYFVRDKLYDSPLYLVEKIRLSKGFHEKLVIFVDQFEEVITQGKRENFEKTNRFIQFILQTLKATDVHVYIITAMRANYLEQCNRFPGFPEALNRNHFLLPPLNREQLREAIIGPQRSVDEHGKKPFEELVFDPVFVNALLNDMEREPSGLPFMQHILLKMFNEARKKEEWKLDQKLYVEHGGLSKAFEIHANDIFDKMYAMRQKACEKMLKSLCSKSVDGEGKRFKRTFTELAEEKSLKIEDIDNVISAFRDNGCQIFTTHRDDDGDECAREKPEDGLITIVHESIINKWKRLSDWADQEAEASTKYFVLHHRALNKNKSLGGLLQTSAAHYKEWWKEQEPTKAWARRCLESHVNTRDGRSFQDKEQGENRLESNGKQNGLKKVKYEEEVSFEEVKKYLDDSIIEEERRKKRYWYATIFMAIVATIVILFGMLALGLKAEAENARKALADQYDIARKKEKDARNAKKRMLDTESRYHISRSAELSKVEKFRQAADHLEKAQKFVGDGELKMKNIYSLVKWQVDLLGDIRAEELVHDENKRFCSVSYSPEYETLAFTGNAGYAAIAACKGGFAVKALTGLDADSMADNGLHSKEVTDCLFHPDGKWLATADVGGSMNFWDLDGKHLKTMEIDTDVLAMDISDDGKYLATGGVRNAKIKIREFDDRQPLTWAIEYPPKGSSLSSQDFKGGDFINALDFSTRPEEILLASASQYGDVMFWRIDSDDLSKTKRLDTDLMKIRGQSVAFLPQNGRGEYDGVYAIGTVDGYIEVFDKDNQNRGFVLLKGHREAVNDLAFDRRGRLYSASQDRTIRVWDWKRGIELKVLEGHNLAVKAIALDNETGAVFSVGNDGLVLRWPNSFETESPLGRFFVEVGDMPSCLAFSPDGLIVAAGMDDGVIRIFDAFWPKSTASNPTSRPAKEDADTRERNIVTLSEKPDTYGKTVKTMSFSPGGNFLASASGNQVEIWKLENGKSTKLVVSEAYEHEVACLTFSKCSKHVFFADAAGRIGTLGTESKEDAVFVDTDHERINSLEFNQNGDIALTSDDSGKAMLWRVDGSKFDKVDEVNEFKGNKIVAALDSEGNQIALGSYYGSGKIVLYSYNKSQKKIEKMFDLEGLKPPVYAIGFCPCDNQLVSLSYEGKLTFWNVSGKTNKKDDDSKMIIQLPVPFDQESADRMDGLNMAIHSRCNPETGNEEFRIAITSLKKELPGEVMFLDLDGVYQCR